MNRFLCVIAMCFICLLPVVALANGDYRLDAGPLTLDIYISKTANLFHAVDQIAQWSEFCHGQYVSYFEGLEVGIDKPDRDLLAQHCAIRKTHGWGGGLEQTFYTFLDLDAALALGVKEERLSKEEAQTERQILTHFQSRVERLMTEESPTLKQFVQQLQAKRSDMVAFADNASHFVGGAKLTIPIYLMANPDERNCGGGFNGGQLTLEIAKNYDMYPMLLHELFHAFIRTKQELIVSAAHSVPGLDEETLSEGLAYAYNPGLIQAGNSGQTDQLLSTVARYTAQGSSLSDSYTRFNTYGLALRPLLKDAFLDKRQTLDAFLPRATDAWLVLTELEKTRGTARAPDYLKDPRHTIFVFGIMGEGGVNMLLKSNPNVSGVCGHSDDTVKFKEMLTKNAKPGDTILLLLSLDTSSRVPAEFSDLMLLSWPEIENLLKQGQTVFRQGKARDMNVFLLATPTIEGTRNEFRRLVTENKFVRDVETKTTGQMHDYRKDPRHSIFVFGILDQDGWKGLQKYNQHLFQRPHHTNEYKEMLTKNTKPGDTILLLLSLDDPGRVPEEFSDLMPLPWSETDNLLKRNQTVFRQGKARNMNVFLLATPTDESLRKEFRRLVAEGKFTLDKEATTK